ncbi:MAG: acyltransferase [Dysgonamonadaceae bacterium]|jgi:hypothetical protein|nr:acyltransferase [Dysgonamonadaceae bacterium]
MESSINTEFDDIRPFRDEELPAVIARLLDNPQFRAVLGYVFKGGNMQELESKIRSFKTIRDFQHEFVKRKVFSIAKQTSDGIEWGGVAKPSADEAYTYISNHRDIVLDASLLNALLVDLGCETTEIAIGDNLLLFDWIEDLVRLNRSFIVRRGVSIRQMLEVSNHLSRYIHYVVENQKHSVWIAQREGRAKNSDDRTQESLLKMLAMGGKAKDFTTNLQSLNILPLAFSYEYDPCDYLKARELQMRRDNPDFKKAEGEDLLNMQTGIFGKKGRIFVQFGKPINSELAKIDHSLPKGEQAKQAAEIIDREIFLNYHFYPGNYIAYDRLWGNGRCSGEYTNADVKVFDDYINRQLGKIVLENRDEEFLRLRILEMYGYPVKNQLFAKGL